MKLLIEGSAERYNRYMPEISFGHQIEKVFFARGSSNEEIVKAGADADVLFVDAISTVDAELINKMPNLKMIHSEGVAYNGIDCLAARQKGIYVCNNRGCNARAVAEQAVMLMLEVLRMGVAGDMAVREGRQMQVKESCMAQGNITELGECKVGLLGFGDIAKETAIRLNAFGCELYYHSPHRKDEATEKRYHVTYQELDDMLKICDIISIHTAVTEQTKGMVNEKFLSKMKAGSYLINTARGEIVDNLALREAIINGTLADAGLDTVAPEPTTADNPLVDMPAEHKYKITLAPHLGGITGDSFRRAHKNMWENVERLLKGEKPVNIVN